MTRNHTLSIIKVAVVVIFIALVLAYALFNSRIFISGPQISINSPENGAVLTDSNLIKIIGEAANISYIHLNDRQIYTDENGHFQEPILLRSGYNIIRIDAEDKFGRSVVEKVEVIFSGSSTSDIENININEDDIDADNASSTDDTNSAETTYDISDTTEESATSTATSSDEF
jgi:capsule polysaccharide export protein KpsE/RkpR